MKLYAWGEESTKRQVPSGCLGRHLTENWKTAANEKGRMLIDLGLLNGIQSIADQATNSVYKNYMIPLQAQHIIMDPMKYMHIIMDSNERYK